MGPDPGSTVLGALLSGVSTLMDPSSVILDVNPDAPAHFRPLRFELADRQIDVHPSEIANIALAEDGIGGFAVQLGFEPTVSAWIAEATTEHAGAPMDMFLCDEVVISPVIREPITGGSMMLTGQLEMEEWMAAVAIIAGQFDCSGTTIPMAEVERDGGRRSGSSRGE